ncbi:MAG: hypothetical protein R3E66_08995 [bacterium]
MRLLFVATLLVLTACGSDSTKKGKSQANACGNGQLDPGEVCDAAIAQGQPGACPTSCAAGGCQVATLEGSATACSARCVVEPVACGDGDGCCPLGCDASSDAECTNVCGNQTVESPETCDGDCPTVCNACAGEALAGSPELCSSRCEVVTSVACTDADGCCPVGCTADSDSDCEPTAECGDGNVDPGESCDGNCPTACTPSGQCRVAALQGSASTCNVACVESVVTSCVTGDGCCPDNCDDTTDGDCSAQCGNNVVDPGETCDGNCPTSCPPPNSCTRTALRGSAGTCNAFCETTQTITACTNNDGCCPAGCTFALDNDCTCTPKTCAQLGAQCGSIDNGCGTMIQCPACTAGRVCNQNTCVTSSGTIGSRCSTDTDCTGTLFCDTTIMGGYCTTSCDP